MFVLLVANALQPAMTGPDASLAGGFVLIVALVGANFLISKLDLLPQLHGLFNAPATVIIKDGHYLPEVLKREGIDQEECETAMREHGVTDLKEVELGVLEPDGSISIVPTGSLEHVKRKVRFHRRA